MTFYQIKVRVFGGPLDGELLAMTPPIKDFIRVPTNPSEPPPWTLFPVKPFGAARLNPFAWLRYRRLSKEAATKMKPAIQIDYVTYRRHLWKHGDGRMESLYVLAGIDVEGFHMCTKPCCDEEIEHDREREA